MTTPLFDQSAIVTKLMSPFIQFNQISAEIFEEGTKVQLQAMQTLFHSQVEHLQQLGQAKGIEEMFRIQAHYMQNITPELMKQSQQMMDSYLSKTAKMSKLTEGFIKDCQKNAGETLKGKKD